MLFGDLGADVIKVERPGVGDDTRAWGPPFAGDEATYFLSVNRNKRSFTADLSDEADRDELAELIRRADVLIENFRPGTMARHGLSYEQVRELNPRLVYCSITGFGAGKGAALPGYDLLVQAVGGLMSVTGPHPGEPVKAGVALVDVLAGLHAAVGVLAALRARETTGRGQLVEVNLLGTLLSSMVNQSAGYTAAGAVHCAGSGVAGALVDQARQQAAEQVHLDQLPVSGGLARAKRREDPDGGVQTGEHVHQGDPRLDRLAGARSGDAHEPADGLHEQVVPGQFGALPGAESGNRAIHQPRVHRADLLVGQPVPGHGAGPEVLDQDVGAPHQLLDVAAVAASRRSAVKERLLRLTDRK